MPVSWAKGVSSGGTSMAQKCLVVGIVRSWLLTKDGMPVAHERREEHSLDAGGTQTRRKDERGEERELPEDQSTGSRAL